MISQVILLLILPIFSTEVFSQEVFALFNKDNSPILSDHIQSISISKLNDIEFISNSKFYRFAGNNWDSIELSIADYTVESGKIGESWVASPASLYLLSEKHNKQIDLPIGLNTDISTLPVLLIDQNDVWYGNYRGLGRYNIEDEWEVVNNEDDFYITGMVLDLNGIIWISRFGGIMKIENHEVEIIRHELFRKYLFSCVVVDNMNCVWFGTHSEGLYKYNGEIWTNYPSTDGLDGNDVSCITVDEANNIWIGTYSNGITIFNGQTWNHFTIDDGLPSNEITDIEVDHENNIWAGTPKGLVGIKYSNSTKIEKEYPKDLSFNIFPNPFNSYTTIEYFLPHNNFVSLSIYDILGQKVVDLVDGAMSYGKHTINWNGKDFLGNRVSSGIYISRFSTGAHTICKKITILK